MFAGVDGGVKLLKVFESKGHLEQIAHFELNAYRLPDHREVFSCDLETVTAAINRVIAEGALGVIGKCDSSSESDRDI